MCGFTVQECGVQRTTEAWFLLRNQVYPLYSIPQNTEDSTASFTVRFVISWSPSKQDSRSHPSRMVIANFSCTWIPSCSSTPTGRRRRSSFHHLSWALTHSMLGQTKYLLNKSFEQLPEMGGVGNKEAITENRAQSNRSCGNREAVISLPLSFCKQRKNPVLCTRVERQSTSGIVCFQRSNLRTVFLFCLSSFTSGEKKKKTTDVILNASLSSHSCPWVPAWDLPVFLQYLLTLALILESTEWKSRKWAYQTVEWMETLENGQQGQVGKKLKMKL